MNVGVIFPHTEIGSDPGAIREFAVGVEELGYTHLLSYDHVLGAGLRTRPGFQGPFNSSHAFHEVLTLFAFLAAVTTRLEFVSGILVLPQRQTALVAKQAAEVDLLSGGRLRLGVGGGWNEVEFIGLNASFPDRGRRFEEQVEVLRRLWTEPDVEFEGEFHTIPDAGINPYPVQRPIPVWIGTRSSSLLPRVARLADGWLPFSTEPDEVRPDWERLLELVTEHGRDAGAMGLEGNLVLREYAPDDWPAQHSAWSELGPSHLSILTTGLGLGSVDRHLALLSEVYNGFVKS